MGRYATVDDQNRLVSNLRSLSVPSSADRAFQIDMVEGEIDSKLVTLYDLPFASSPPLVQRIALDLSMYMVVRAIHTGDSPVVTEWAEKWKEAREILDQVAVGKIALVSSAQVRFSPRTDVREVESPTRTYKPVFDMRDVISQEIDADRLTDEADE